MYVLSNSSDFFKSYGHLSEILAFYNKHSPIWLSHVTPDAKFHLICNKFQEKSRKFKCATLLLQSYWQRPQGKWKTPHPPPVLIGLNFLQALEDCDHFRICKWYESFVASS